MVDPAAEYLRRALSSLMDARNATLDNKARYLAAAVENSVAIVECRLTEASDKNRVRQFARDYLPRYQLLKRVRIHNFHRRPIPYYSPETRAESQIFEIFGPIELTSGSEPQSVSFGSLSVDGPNYEAAVSGKLNRQAGGTEKEIVIIDGLLWDETSEQGVDLVVAIEEYLSRVPEFLEALKGGSSTSSS